MSSTLINSRKTTINRMVAFENLKPANNLPALAALGSVL